MEDLFAQVPKSLRGSPALPVPPELNHQGSPARSPNKSAKKDEGVTCEATQQVNTRRLGSSKDRVHSRFDRDGGLQQLPCAKSRQHNVPPLTGPPLPVLDMVLGTHRQLEPRHF